MSCRARKKYTFPLWGFVLLVLILPMGLIGVSVASWQDNLTAESTVTVANIEAVFTHVQPERRTAGSAGASLGGLDNSDTVYLNISDAAPGSSYSFSYTLANEGSIPVRFWTAESHHRSKEITVTNDLERDLLDTDGGTIRGTINVSIKDVAEETYYNYRLPMLYHHWNSSPGELSWHGYLYMVVEISTGRWLEAASSPADSSSSEAASPGTGDQEEAPAEEVPAEEVPSEEKAEKDEEDHGESKSNDQSLVESSSGTTDREEEAEAPSTGSESTGISNNPETGAGSSSEESEQTGSHDEADHTDDDDNDD